MLHNVQQLSCTRFNFLRHPLASPSCVALSLHPLAHAPPPSPPPAPSLPSKKSKKRWTAQATEGGCEHCKGDEGGGGGGGGSDDDDDDEKNKSKNMVPDGKGGMRKKTAKELADDKEKGFVAKRGAEKKAEKKKRDKALEAAIANDEKNKALKIGGMIKAMGGSGAVKKRKKKLDSDLKKTRAKEEFARQMIQDTRCEEAMKAVALLSPTSRNLGLEPAPSSSSEKYETTGAGADAEPLDAGQIAEALLVGDRDDCLDGDGKLKVKYQGGVSTSASTSGAGSAAAGGARFKVVAQEPSLRLVNGRVAERTWTPGAANKIHLQFRLDRPVPSGAIPEVGNLTGSTTPDTLALDVGGAAKLRVGYDMEPSRAQWRRQDGVVHMQALSGFKAGEAIDLTFTLANPPAATTPKMPSLRVNGAVVERGSLLAAAHGGVLGSTAPSVSSAGLPDPSTSTKRLKLILGVVDIQTHTVRGQDAAGSPCTVGGEVFGKYMCHRCYARQSQEFKVDDMNREKNAAHVGNWIEDRFTFEPIMVAGDDMWTKKVTPHGNEYVLNRKFSDFDEVEVTVQGPNGRPFEWTYPAGKHVEVTLGLKMVPSDAWECAGKAIPYQVPITIGQQQALFGNARQLSFFKGKLSKDSTVQKTSSFSALHSVSKWSKDGFTVDLPEYKLDVPAITKTDCFEAVSIRIPYDRQHVCDGYKWIPGQSELSLRVGTYGTCSADISVADFPSKPCAETPQTAGGGQSIDGLVNQTLAAGAGGAIGGAGGGISAMTHDQLVAAAAHSVFRKIVTGGKLTAPMCRKLLDLKRKSPRLTAELRKMCPDATVPCLHRRPATLLPKSHLNSSAANKHMAAAAKCIHNTLVKAGYAEARRQLMRGANITSKGGNGGNGECPEDGKPARTTLVVGDVIVLSSDDGQNGRMGVVVTTSGKSSRVYVE